MHTEALIIASVPSSIAAIASVISAYLGKQNKNITGKTKDKIDDLTPKINEMHDEVVTDENRTEDHKT